ncbi:Sec-independent protein translocase subunit TatA [Symbioplanes lichenis]|uniref:Sec-independent protein translocase subunit TatA n=1 Tax=Symbioplanes lichenis TaxID=1629072 RepID=UPI002738A325|nr:Sec-independent protein translocase subunit TatA [Actinoplanes lichenis]
MGALKPWHIAIFVVVLVLLFGAKRLPDAARSLGRSLRIIKAETKGLVDDNNDAEKAEAQRGYQPLQGEVQQGYAPPPPGYQQPPAGYQQPPTGYQPPQGQPQGQPYQPPQPPAPDYVNPVQQTKDR